MRAWFIACFVFFVFTVFWLIFCISQGWHDLLPLNIFSVVAMGYSTYVAGDMLD